MKVNFYLVISSSGSVKTFKNRPGLSWNEVAILQRIELPDGLFKKPMIEAKLVIPDEAAVPQLIDAETEMNVREAIEQATGLEVRLSVLSQEGE